MINIDPKAAAALLLIGTLYVVTVVGFGIFHEIQSKSLLDQCQRTDKVVKVNAKIRSIYQCPENKLRLGD